MGSGVCARFGIQTQHVTSARVLRGRRRLVGARAGAMTLTRPLGPWKNRTKLRYTVLLCSNVKCRCFAG